jgi:hypothetical protein
MEKIAQVRLHEILHYAPDTGVFTWLPREGDISFGAWLVGRRTGRVNAKSGYRRIRLSGVSYPEHRLAWFYTYGKWPTCIDHIDNNRANNAISNLRDIPQRLNVARQRSKNPLGKGVHRYGKKLFHATITQDGVVHKLGVFETPEEARVAYAVKARELWGEFAE